MNQNGTLSGEFANVTYDEGAQASFFYCSMKSQQNRSPETGVKYSRFITPEADLAFDPEGGLVWIRFPARDAGKSSAEFVSRIDAPLCKLIVENPDITQKCRN